MISTAMAASPKRIGGKGQRRRGDLDADAGDDGRVQKRVGQRAHPRVSGRVDQEQLTDPT
jgi:hypothetical protein